MAKYFLLMKVFSRGKGARVTRAAAYRAGERIHDVRTGENYNYSDRKDVVHKDILLPSQSADSPDLNWARDRPALWNAAENGVRRNARLAREVLVTLPPELPQAERTNLARRFAQELSDRYRNAVDVAVHEPRQGSDPRHHHAHLLMTTREVTSEGLGPRTILDLSGRERHARGLGPSKDELLWIRERWATVANEAFKSAGLEERIDHRSYAAQGIDADPKAFIPDKVRYAEAKSGVSSKAGDEIRARHRERVEARAKGTAEFARIVQKQKEEARLQAIEYYSLNKGQPKRISRASLTREEINEIRRAKYQSHKEEINQKRREKRRERFGPPKEQTAAARHEQSAPARQDPSVPSAEESVRNWLAYRERQRAEVPSTASQDRSQAHDRGRDDDENEAKAGRKRDNDFAL